MHTRPSVTLFYADGSTAWIDTNQAGDVEFHCTACAFVKAFGDDLRSARRRLQRHDEDGCPAAGHPVGVYTPRHLDTLPGSIRVNTGQVAGVVHGGMYFQR